MDTRFERNSKNDEINEKCSDWVKSKGLSSELAASDLRELDSEVDDDANSDVEFDSVSECNDRKRRKVIISHKKTELLNLVCEWLDCDFTSQFIEKYVNHVANHVTQLEIKLEDNGNEVYLCQWNNCNYTSDDSAKITRHVNYHSYHNKLKCFGTNIRSQVKLPKCLRESTNSVVFNPDVQLICQWEECLRVFSNFQMFLFHVTQHVECLPKGNKVRGGVKCKWSGCSSSFPSSHKLKDHIKCHSKEKTVACPTCGAIFASNTKFYYHCRRQIPLEIQGFQCSHCNKYYPTEDILKEHMRLHIYHYKCTMCEMSCESRASLVKHVRYRHIDSRPFHCQLCSHSAKSQQDLDSHMTVHTNGPNFFCNYEGCSYTCKNAYVLDRHIERVHQCEVRWYCCHECPVKFQKSYSLTKHLLETHKLQWPKGHKRFQYVRDNDGCFRLQDVRYECIDEDDNNDVLGDPSKDYKVKINVNNDNLVDAKLEIVEDNGYENSKVLEVNDDFDFTLNAEMSGNIGKSMPVISNILISIDEMDADGNIIDSKVIETQETSVLPASDGPPVIIT